MKIRKGAWVAEFTVGGNVEICHVVTSTPAPRMYGGMVIERADVSDVSKLIECASYGTARAVHAACELYDVTIENPY